MMGRCSGTWWTLPVEVFYAMEVVVGVSAASRVGLVAFGAAIEGKTATGWYALTTFVVLSYTQLAASTLGWSPLFPLLGATLVWAIGAYGTSSAPPGVTPV